MLPLLSVPYVVFPATCQSSSSSVLFIITDNISNKLYRNLQAKDLFENVCMQVHVGGENIFYLLCPEEKDWEPLH